MTRNSASRFSSETGFFHSHSRKARLCHSGCLSDSDVFFTLHYSSGKSLCQHLMHLIPISPPPPPAYWTIFLVKSSSPVGRSVFLSLSPSLLLWVVFICPDSSVPHHQLYEMTAHILELQQGLFTEKEQHTHTLSNKSYRSPTPHVCTYTCTLFHTVSHTHPPHPHPVLDLIQRCVCSSSPLALRGHVRGRGKLHTRLIRLTPESQWNSSTTATEIFTQLTANSRISVLHY